MMKRPEIVIINEGQGSRVVSWIIGLMLVLVLAFVIGALK